MKLREMVEKEDASTVSTFQRCHMETEMSPTTCTVFNELRLDGQLCDVVLKVDSVDFNAHKNILCGCSSYFR